MKAEFKLQRRIDRARNVVLAMFSRWFSISRLEGNTMKSRSAGFVTGLLVFMLSAPAMAQSSKDWVDLNAKELRDLYSNKTFKGRGPDGGSFVGHYRSDGKGVLIIMGGQRIPRTWVVKGNDQVCVTDAKATNCFSARRHKTNKNEFVLQHVTAGWIAQFTVEDGIPQF
jgi:hypothetical protein